MEEEELGWEELRKEARKVESDLDVKLSSYTKLANTLTNGGHDGSEDALAADGSWKSVKMEIESLLEKLLNVNDAMGRCVARTASTASVTQKVARHREILQNFTQEFRRTKGTIGSMHEHADLLNSVRNDVDEYKGAGSSLLKEQGAVHGQVTQEMLQVEVELRLLEALEIYHPAKLQGMHRHFILYGLMEYLERRLNHRFSSNEILEILDRFYNLEVMKPDEEESELLNQEEEFSLPASILAVKEETKESS